MQRFLALLLFCAAAQAATPRDDMWMSVLLDGRKIGSMHTTRTVQADRVITQQAMAIELDRAGIKIGLATSETNEETTAGVPIAFESRTKISGIETVVRGTVLAGGKVEIVSDIGGAKQTRTITWPPGAMLAEGLRLAEQRAGLKPGTHYRSLAFQAESLDAVEVDSRVGDRATIDLPDGKRRLVRVEQTIKLPGAPTRTVAWVDDDYNVTKLLLPVMGYELTMLACKQSCAQAPNQSADILLHALVQAPRALTADERAHGVRLKLHPDSDEPLQFARTDEQQATTNANAIELQIAPLTTATPSIEGKPEPGDFRANDWLQSDAPPIVKLAADAVGDAKTPREQMQRLETFVRGYITNKNLSVGYASALEVAKNPEGDCTEHAVLLAALGRARGIATRVVDGLAYVDSYAGNRYVFVPHAWAQAYVDGHWQSFDAALPGFDAGHIALSVGDGDPWRFFAGFNTLGRLRIDAIEPLTTP